MLSAVLAALLAPAARASTCHGDEVTYTLTMTDTYGDGWNNAEWAFTRSSDGVTTTGTLDAGASGTAALCLAPADDGGCHAFAVSAGSYPSEVGWSIASEAGMTVGSGSAPTTTSVCFMPPPSPDPTVSVPPSVIPTHSIGPITESTCEWEDARK